MAVLKGKKLAEAVAAGEKELKAGKVAALLVAGGQGSRLGYDGPKGCYSIGPITGAPLFYFHARKILARSVRYGKPIPFYVMTSEANNAATVACFEEHNYFGLNPKDVFFFTQGMWPGMTKDGKIILDAPGHVFMSPDGHGGLIAALKRSGVSRASSSSRSTIRSSRSRTPPSSAITSGRSPSTRSSSARSATRTRRSACRWRSRRRA